MKEADESTDDILRHLLRDCFESTYEYVVRRKPDVTSSAYITMWELVIWVNSLESQLNVSGYTAQGDHYGAEVVVATPHLYELVSTTVHESPRYPRDDEGDMPLMDTYWCIRPIFRLAYIEDCVNDFLFRRKLNLLHTLL